jgi:hypothetical protein
VPNRDSRLGLGEDGDKVNCVKIEFLFTEALITSQIRKQPCSDICRLRLN